MAVNNITSKLSSPEKYQISQHRVILLNLMPWQHRSRQAQM